MTTDAETVRLAQAGDEAAWSAIYATHRPKVYASMLRMTGNAADAEDLTQDAFLQVFRKLQCFRGESRLSTWIWRVALNIALMRFRRMNKCPSVSIEALAEVAAAHGAEPVVFHSKDRRLQGTVDRIALTGAISALPAGYRTVFVLHEIYGYDHGEVAEILGRSVGCSKSQLSKSKRSLRFNLSVRAIKARARRGRVMVRQAL